MTDILRAVGYGFCILAVFGIALMLFGILLKVRSGRAATAIGILMIVAGTSVGFGAGVASSITA